jgi:hypothetical protein
MIRLYSMPTAALGVAIVGLTVAVSLLILFVVRRLMQRIKHPGNDVVYCFLGATGMIYALVLGLLAVAAWDSLKSVEDAATKEAMEANKLYWDLSGYAPADRDRLRSMLCEYLRTVIEVEWPQQQKGVTIGEPRILAEMAEGWTRVEPVTEGQKLIHAEALGELNELLAFSRIRRQANDLSLPLVLWAVVLLGGVLNIVLAAMIRTESPLALLLLVAALAVMIGLMIFEIVAVDHPLWGEVSVPSTPYREVLKSIGR